METKDKYKELETKFGPHTAELQRRIDESGAIDFKFFVCRDAIQDAKNNGATTDELVESMAKSLLELEDAETIEDKELY